MGDQKIFSQPSHYCEFLYQRHAFHGFYTSNTKLLIIDLSWINYFDSHSIMSQGLRVILLNELETVRVSVVVQVLGVQRHSDMSMYREKP